MESEVQLCQGEAPRHVLWPPQPGTLIKFTFIRPLFVIKYYLQTQNVTEST